MDIFKTYPSLCSLFLTTLEDWGAETLDWTLLGDEAFVDTFLRRLVVSENIEPAAVELACSSFLQPSPGGLLAAIVLKSAGHFADEEFHEFVNFTLQGSCTGWPPLSWNELTDLLEYAVFDVGLEEASWTLACLMAKGWVSRDLQAPYFRRVWQTNRLSLANKKSFFRWLYGQQQFSGLPKAPSSFPDEKFSLKVAYRLSSSKTPYSDRRRGVSGTRKKRRVVGQNIAFR